MATYLLVLLVAMLACTSMGLRPVRWKYKRTSLGDTIDKASMKLFKETYESSENKNIVISPFSVLSLLSLYTSGSEGKNKDEIMNLLSSTDYKELSESYSVLSESLKSMNSSYLALANKIFVSDKYSLDKDFTQTVRSFKSEVDNINFGDPVSAAHIMNDWASKYTEGKISHPVDASDFDPLTVVALLNVMFFKGHLGIPFNASETKDQDFYTANAKSVKKPMMHLLQSFYCHEDKELGARLIELPYQESKLRMVVVVPDEVEGLPEVVKKVAEKGLLEDVFRLFPAGVDVDFYMPKFEIKSKHNFNDILPKVGVASIFHNESHGIVEKAEVKVDKVFQEAFVRIDEEDASDLFKTSMSYPGHNLPPELYKVDRPFLFTILHDDIILFLGTYAY